MNIHTQINRLRQIALKVMRGQRLQTPPIWSGYTRDATHLIDMFDCAPDDIHNGTKPNSYVESLIHRRTCNWYIPVFNNPSFGGLHTIFRLAAFLQLRYGIRQRFIICGPADISHISRLIRRSQDILSSCEVIILADTSDLTTIPASDYSICTLWITAYILLRVTNTALKFYMIQDYEPGFYPNGTTHAQAELTYSFGFYGICNTESILTMYQSHGGRGVVLVPSVDTSIFYSSSRPHRQTKRLFLYARPGTPRNGFELAFAALKEAKRYLGPKIDICCAGEEWPVGHYDEHNFMTNLGVLSIEQTASLYRDCDIGIALMMTRHPSYLPIELMASGVLVISNVNRFTGWFMKDQSNCLLCLPTKSSLSNSIIHAVEHYEELSHIRLSASHAVTHHLGTWDENLQKVCEYILSIKPSL